MIWWKVCKIIALDRVNVWLIDSDPVFYTVAKLFEAHIGISSEVFSASEWTPSQTLLQENQMKGEIVKVYTIFGLKTPEYSSSRAWGRSK